MPSAGQAAGACCACTLCVATLVLILSSATVIPVGYVGVVTFLGTASKEPLFPGMSFVNPLSSVVSMNQQTQIFHFADYVPTQEGVNVYLEASCLVHLDASKAVEVYSEVGESYTDVILIPQFQSVVREVTSDHTAAALYTAEARQNMTSGLRSQLQAMCGPFGLIVESTPINKLTLPKTISDAIEKKMTLQQEAESMDFVLDKERQEAQRRVIEAQGIANYQNIISSNTTDGMLRWNAISATEAISESCNAKVIFLGDGGLPVVHSQKPAGDTTPEGVPPNQTELGGLSVNISSFDAPKKILERQRVQQQQKQQQQQQQRTLKQARSDAPEHVEVQVPHDDRQQRVRERAKWH